MATPMRRLGCRENTEVVHCTLWLPTALLAAKPELANPLTRHPAYVVCSGEHAIGQVLDGKVAVRSDFNERHFPAGFDL